MDLLAYTGSISGLQKAVMHCSNCAEQRRPGPRLLRVRTQGRRWSASTPSLPPMMVVVCSSMLQGGGMG
jgi:hypothetical protein